METTQTLNGGKTMRLVRYNPFSELDFWGNTFNNFFNDSPLKSRRAGSWSPSVDIVSNDDHVMIHVELPGMKKEDISVNIEENVLTVKGERNVDNEENKDTYYRRERMYGSFKRSFSLSDDIMTDEVGADYKDGILKIKLKKDHTKEEVKQITIN